MRRLLTLSGHVGRTLCRALPLPAALALSLAILGAAATAKAELRVDITRGHVEPLPIALVDLAGASEADAKIGRQITQVITRNLERSGLFRAIDPAAFISEPGGMSVRPRFQDWRIINAQALVTGRVVPSDTGRLTVEFRLWDVFAEQDLVGLKLSGSTEAWRPIAHTMSDKIYERLTGESGYFHTRVVYIAETGPPDKRIKRLAIMDQDGHNLRYLSDGRHLVLTPRFSPTAQEITYLSYERGVPKVYLRHIDTGQQEILGDFPGMTFAPRFSPDGNHVVMTLARDGNSEIYEMDLRSRGVTRLTNNPAIETAPCYSPDGQFIAFESDRGGSQQIYVMRRDGSDVRRITFGEGRYGTPVWSPRGDLIAFTKSHRGQFSIGVMKIDGSGERILARDYLVEGPTWAPNGRVLMFFRSSSRDPDSAELVTIDLTGRNERILFTSTAASDPAWSPLIQ
ncbi:MAG: Tol-Pal system beta propeller repeat protein TolB [Rhodospirillales bacterium]|nr:Tol-Pal system beta propeller repeat protein TolB [Rhodospirillales bacterium]